MASTTTTITQVARLTRSACDILAPLVRNLYVQIDDSTRTQKKDSSLFSIADGLVQHAFFQWFFKDKIPHLVGEESADINVSSPPYTVARLEIPPALWPAIDTARADILALSSSLPPVADLIDTVFLDPIDGTREFCTGLGHQSTICVGFARLGSPVGGLVYRPIPQPPSWALGSRQEASFEGNLATPDGAESGLEPGFLTTNGSISPFLARLMERLGYRRVPSGGAGNKMLMLIEGHGAVYLQDRGLSRWDTCGAQAVLEAQGGFLVKLAPFVERERALEGYQYKETLSNLDVVAGQAKATLYNRASKEVAAGTVVENAAQVLPYCNLAGLLAVRGESNTPENLQRLYEAIQQVIQEGNLPSYD